MLTKSTADVSPIDRAHHRNPYQLVGPVLAPLYTLLRRLQWGCTEWPRGTGEEPENDPSPDRPRHRQCGVLASRHEDPRDRGGLPARLRHHAGRPVPAPNP